MSNPTIVIGSATHVVELAWREQPTDAAAHIDNHDDIRKLAELAPDYYCDRLNDSGEYQHANGEIQRIMRRYPGGTPQTAGYTARQTAISKLLDWAYGHMHYCVPANVGCDREDCPVLHPDRPYAPAVDLAGDLAELA